jgi:hypothetical protein
MAVEMKQETELMAMAFKKKKKHWPTAQKRKSKINTAHKHKQYNPNRSGFRGVPVFCLKQKSRVRCANGLVFCSLWIGVIILETISSFLHLLSAWHLS